MNRNNYRFLNELYKILATLNYNNERRKLLEELLKQFLVDIDIEIDIVSKHRDMFDEKRELDKLDSDEKEEKHLKSEWFKQECLLLSNIPHEYIPEYTIKFSPFSKDFEKIYGFNMDFMWLFSFKLIEYIEFKKYMIQFEDDVYEFNSKEEYSDLGFTALPPTDYVEKWSNVITFDVSELKRIFSGIISGYDIELILEILCLTEIPGDGRKIYLPFTPMLRIDSDMVVLLTPWYLTRALPSIYENLFKKSKKYLDHKGKTFEKLAQNTLKALPFKAIAFNVNYGNKGEYETDAIVKLNNSLWVAEVTSHPPSSKSLKGDWKSIERDLERSINKCMRQGKRYLKYVNGVHFLYFSEKAKTRGIFIIVDGVYPQLNLNMAIEFFAHEKEPIYIINWFDLRTLIDQPEINQFEGFLSWRTQQPMPIICFDEKDYWAFYFDRFVKDKEIRKGFEKMQRDEVKLFYISHRFNNKKHLEKIT